MAPVKQHYTRYIVKRDRVLLNKHGEERTILAMLRRMDDHMFTSYDDAAKLRNKLNEGIAKRGHRWKVYKVTVRYNMEYRPARVSWPKYVPVAKDDPLKGVV